MPQNQKPQRRINRPNKRVSAPEIWELQEMRYARILALRYSVPIVY